MASITQRKDGKGTNIRTNVDITIKTYDGKVVNFPKGTYINRVDPRKEVEFALEKGWIDEDKAAQRLEGIKDFVLFDLNLNYEE